MYSHNVTLLACTCLWWLAGHNAELLDIPGLTQTVYESLGDVNLGGVFPLHNSGQYGAYCGALRELGVLQRAEAMAFYINKINKDEKTLPNVTLGYVILDDCYKEMTALAQGLNFVQKVDVSNNSMARDVVAVIGAESSTNSKQLAELLGLFEIPQVSYLSTNPKLTDKYAYPYFTRIVPSDFYQIKGMISLLMHFKWNYVSFVYTKSTYGIDAYLLMAEEVSRAGINVCLAAQVVLDPLPSAEDYKKALKRLMYGTNDKRSHAVILFLPLVSATKLLQTAANENMYGKFTWIASDAWGRNVQDFSGVEGIAEGTIKFKIESSNDPVFDAHFSNLNPANTPNPFVSDFWQEAVEGLATPSISVNVTRSPQQLQSTRAKEPRTFGDLPSYKPETTVSLVKIAVYLIAYRLHDLQQECLNKNGYQSELCFGKLFRKYVTGRDLRDRLRGTSGCLSGTDSDCINVDRQGEGRSKYTILNMRMNHSTNEYTLQPIGYYDTAQNNGSLVMFNESKIAWNPFIPSKEFKNNIPLSICSKPCAQRQKQVRSSSFQHPKCCWNCELCADNEITIVLEVEGLPTTQCQACEHHQGFPKTLNLYTSPSGNQCIPVVPQYLGFEDPAALTVVVLDCVCLISTLVLLLAYLRNKEHRLIKATSRELSYVIWSGILFSYVSVFLFFVPLHEGCLSREDCNPQPLTHWCYIQYIAFSLSSTLITAPMITRANRIYRIFQVGKKSAKKPKFIENRFQFTFVAILVGAQTIIVILCCLSSYFGRNISGIAIRNVLDHENIAVSYIFCEIPYYVLLPPVVFNFLLGVICAYQAFQTRKLPDNFNESRFIGMTIYSAVIVWIAFIPSYVTITNQLYKVVPLVLALLIIAVITTLCLFVPRIYALRWVDGGKMNLRSLSMSVSSVSADQSKASMDRYKISSKEMTSKHKPALAENSVVPAKLEQQISCTTTTDYMTDPSSASVSPDMGDNIISSI